MNNSIETVPITLMVSREWAERNAERLAAVRPSTAHPIPGERILDLGLSALANQARILARTRARREASKPRDEKSFDPMNENA